MHTLTAVAAGLQDYCKTACRFKGDIDIYLDGLRFAGSTYECTNFEKWIENRARYLGLTFKTSDSIKRQQYTFLGVDYDHSEKRCRLSQRSIRKLPSYIPPNAPLHEYESLIARLIYASTVLGIYLPQFYWSTKFMRRKLSQLNKGIIRDTTEIILAQSISSQMERWLAIKIQFLYLVGTLSFSSSFLSPATGIVLLLYALCRPALRPKLSLFLGDVGDALPPHHPSPAHSLSGFSSHPGFLPFAPFPSRGAMRHGGLP